MKIPAFAASGPASLSHLSLKQHGSFCGLSSKASQFAGRPRALVARRAKPAAAPSTTPRASAITTAAGTGKIRVIPDKEVSVGDVLYIEYEPPAGVFNLDSEDMLYWAGGFKNWTGDSADETLMFPLVKLGPSQFRVSLCVPDYAESIKFGFCDSNGFAWDMGYSVPVKYRKRGKNDGTVEEFVATEEGEEAVAETVAGGEFDADLARESASPPVLTVDAEENLHKMRGEAQIVGEESGIGSVFISQVRDTFARFDDDRSGLVKVSQVGNILSALNFDLDDDRVSDLTSRFIGSTDICTMAEFMALYCHLESNDEGLDIV